MRGLAFLFGWWVWRPYSVFVSAVLRFKGVQVGKNFYIQGVPYLKIRGRARDIVIGNNVSVMGNIDIRNRERGRIIFDENVTLDTDCRFVAANDAVLHLKPNTRVGPYCIFNCGADVTIGEDTLFAGFCYVQSSNHGIRKGQTIHSQPHTYGKIDIGADVWLAGHVSVLAGVKVGEGVVVGAKAVVTKDIPPYAVVAGVPAKVVDERK